MPHLFSLKQSGQIAKPQPQLQQKGSSFVQQWQVLFFFRLRRRVPCALLTIDFVVQWFFWAYMFTHDDYGVGYRRYGHADGDGGGLYRFVLPAPDP